MDDNPYSSLIGMMREEGAYSNFPSLMIGRVTNPLPNIEVTVDKMPLYKDDLLIDKWLLDRNNIGFTCSKSYSCPDDKGHSHIISTSNELKNTLQKGDKVLLARFENEEKLVIISKVVNL